MLTTFPASLSQKAGRALERLGVTPLVGHTVVGIADGSVRDRRPRTATSSASPRARSIWAAGVTAPAWPRASRRGRGRRRPRRPGHGRVRTSPRRGTPRSSPSATWSGCGGRTARSSRCRGSPPSRSRRAGMPRGRSAPARGRSTRPVPLPRQGQSRHDRTVEGRRRRQGGPPGRFPGLVTWLLVHLFYLSGFQNRLLVVLRWTIGFVTRGRGARLIVEGPVPAAADDPVEEIRVENAA